MSLQYQKAKLDGFDAEIAVLKELSKEGDSKTGKFQIHCFSNLTIPLYRLS